MPDWGTAYRTYQDYDGEVSSAKINVATWTSENMVAEQAKLVTLWSAIDAITLGNMVRHGLGNVYQEANPTLPSSEYAQRESKWLVTGHDTTTGKAWRMELPCADLTNLDPDDRKHANIGDADVVDAFVTALEAIAKSDDGNAITVDEITFVGRNT